VDLAGDRTMMLRVAQSAGWTWWTGWAVLIAWTVCLTVCAAAWRERAKARAAEKDHSRLTSTCACAAPAVQPARLWMHQTQRMRDGQGARRVVGQRGQLGPKPGARWQAAPWMAHGRRSRAEVAQVDATAGVIGCHPPWAATRGTRAT
jgi:hypothetical protein